MLSNFSKVLMAHVFFTAVIINRGIGKGIGGATPSSPPRASISRKRKIHVNEGKYKQRGSGSSTSSSGKGNTTCAWGRVKNYPKQHFAVVSGNLRCNAYSLSLCLPILYKRQRMVWITELYLTCRKLIKYFIITMHK